MFRIIIPLIYFIINFNNNNDNNIINNIKSIKSDCNLEAYKITNNYDLYNNYNINDINYINDYNKTNNTIIKENIEYNNILLKCINRFESKIINDLIISYLILFALIIFPYI